MKAPSVRTHVAGIIAAVLGATRGAPEPVVRAALRAAFPFGDDRGYRYRVYRDEVRRQRGRARCHPWAIPRRRIAGSREYQARLEAGGQLRLFAA